MGGILFLGLRFCEIYTGIPFSPRNFSQKNKMKNEVKFKRRNEPRSVFFNWFYVQETCRGRPWKERQEPLPSWVSSQYIFALEVPFATKYWASDLLNMMLEIGDEKVPFSSSSNVI